MPDSYYGDDLLSFVYQIINVILPDNQQSDIFNCQIWIIN